MLLIDDILSVDRNHAVSQTRISDQWPGYDGSAVSPLLIIELVAQTSGLSNGLDRMMTEGPAADKRGWIVGIKEARFSACRLVPGTLIITEASNSFKFEGFREIKGASRIGTDVVGEVVLQVMRSE
jgi:predicted hotdog family 3-hydroxylacyl-ACP dehydratase